MLDCVRTLKYVIVILAISASRHLIICVTVSPIPMHCIAHVRGRLLVYYLVLRWLQNVSFFLPTYGASAVPGTEGTTATDAKASSDLTRAFPEEPESSAPDQKAEMGLKGERGVGGVLLSCCMHPGDMILCQYHFQVLYRRRSGGKVVGEWRGACDVPARSFLS